MSGPARLSSAEGARASRPRAARVAVVGDALLDRDVEGTVERLCPDAPVPVVDRPVERTRPGGAALAASLAAADGHAVTLIAALGDDAAGAELRALLSGRGVELVDLGLAAPTPEKTRVLAAGRPLLRVDRGERRPEAVGPATAAARAAIAAADAILVSDYGRGVAAAGDTRALLAEAAADRPLVWDPHPAGPEPVPGCALATPNAAEAVSFASAAAAPGANGGGGALPADGAPPGTNGDAAAAGAPPGRRRAAAAGRRLRAGWACPVAVTLGEGGAVLLTEGEPRLVPAPLATGDTCGAGDRFASRAAGALAAGAALGDAVEAAVAAASGFVDAGGAVGWASRAARRERLVATGGCFDLLHAGHVRTLAAARALGDRLVVCLNSDRSVAALKGPGRPLVPAAERAAVLEALECVDAVTIFDEPTPAAAIERLRPDVWVKGGDYVADELPEAAAVRACGGEVVVLPYLRGHSTTRLIEEAVQRNAA